MHPQECVHAGRKKKHRLKAVPRKEFLKIAMSGIEWAVNGDQKARKYGGRCWKSDLRWGIVQGGVGRSPEGDWKLPLERGTDVPV